jgi:hypothetical protein
MQAVSELLRISSLELLVFMTPQNAKLDYGVIWKYRRFEGAFCGQVTLNGEEREQIFGLTNKITPNRSREFPEDIGIMHSYVG